MEKSKTIIEILIGLAALMVAVAACIVSIVNPEIRQLAGLDRKPAVVVQQTPTSMQVPPTMMVTQPTATSVLMRAPTTTSIPPTAARQFMPTSTPKSPETIRTEFSVPCNSKAGTRVDAPISGHYMISYVSGSYSPEPWASPSDLHWRSRVSIYRNRNIEFGAREFQQGDATGITYYEPTSPDAIFDGNYTKMTQSQSEAAARAASAVALDLAKGEFLFFVCMDDEPYFSDNQGAMKFVLMATGR